MDPVVCLFAGVLVSRSGDSIAGVQHDTETFLPSGHPNLDMNCGDGHVLGCLE